MVSIVDVPAKNLVVEGSTPPAGLPGRLVQDHSPSGPCQTDGAGQSRNPGADDMKGSTHPATRP
jgi:hypothetical protein